MKFEIDWTIFLYFLKRSFNNFFQSFNYLRIFVQDCFNVLHTIFGMKEGIKLVSLAKK